MAGFETMTSNEQPSEQSWPMGAVTRRTGISEHTLRAWERRFGFPRPERLASGHRRYPLEQVQRLLLVNDALALGYRAGDVVPLEREAIAELLWRHGTLSASSGEAPDGDWVAAVLDACRRFDRPTLIGLMRREAANLGTPRLVRERLIPVLQEVGEAWVRGEFEIRHEHFFSEVLEDQLRVLRAPLELTGSGRPVVLACLPGEHHGLGLQIAALSIAIAERSLRILGLDTPVDEIVAAAAAIDAAAVGVSISRSNCDESVAEMLDQLHQKLPDGVRLWLGGAGAGLLPRRPEGSQVVSSFEAIERELTMLDR